MPLYNYIDRGISYSQSPYDILIAASNTPDDIKHFANIKCLGANDHLRIQEAEDYLANSNCSGRIGFLPGYYVLGNTITKRASISWQGPHWGLGGPLGETGRGGARLYMASGVNKDMIKNANYGTNTTDDYWGIADLTLDGNVGGNTTAGSALELGKVSMVNLNRLHILNFQDDGIAIEGPNSSNPAFSVFGDELEIANCKNAALRTKNFINSHFGKINYTGSSSCLYGLYLDTYTRNVGFGTTYLELADITSGIHIIEDVYNVGFGWTRITLAAGNGIVLQRGTLTPTSICFMGGIVTATGATGDAAFYQKNSGGGLWNVELHGMYLRHAGAVGLLSEAGGLKMFGGLIEVCGTHGIHLKSTASWNQFFGVTIDRSGQGGVSTYGMYFNGATRCDAIGCTARNSDGATQTHGFIEDGVANSNKIIGCTAIANATAQITTVGAATVSANNITA